MNYSKNKLTWLSLFLIGVFVCSKHNLDAQEDLLSLLDTQEEVEYAAASFKTSRIINLHSLENAAAGVMDIKISHRFGFLNGGLYELFGLDQASIRIGADFGITDRLMVGLGRSSFEKQYDGFVKYKVLRQSSGKKVMPVTLSLFGSMSINTLRFNNEEKDDNFSGRLSYVYQMIVGRKFSDKFTLQLSPTFIHRNLVATAGEENDVLAIGIGGRHKITNRLAINIEYIYVLPDQLADQYTNSLSIGFDIETGGHVFQLHFTNSTSMVEKGFITENIGEWGDMGVHFGFNVSRVFNLGNKNGNNTN